MIRHVRPKLSGNGKTKLGRLSTYVRDDRAAGDAAALAVWFTYSPDRRGEHPHRHLAAFHGTLQADGYAGFNRLYDSDRIREAACWAHMRRKFFDLHQAHASPIATEAVERSVSYTRLKVRSAAAHPRNGNECATVDLTRCSQFRDRGSNLA